MVGGLVSRRNVRRCALAVAVLLDIDLVPSRYGVRLPGTPSVLVRWHECRLALAGHDPETSEGRRALARWLLRRRWVADHVRDDLAERARPVGLPPGHALHPGWDWVLSRIPGGALDLGLGFTGLQPGHPDRVIVVPPALLRAAGHDARAWWPRACAYLDAMSELAIEHWQRDATAALRPMGEADVCTLLGAASYRAALAGIGVRAVAVPMRHRGWLDVVGLDPAFAPAAAAATDPVDRGYARPLLVTADRIVLAAGGAAQDSSTTSSGALLATASTSDRASA